MRISRHHSFALLLPEAREAIAEAGRFIDARMHRAEQQAKVA